ncbi:MAG: type II toxin-antitoxin system prevent-host-death family antitoxin [Dermatophilus congolensis]|nr:type II toxin-antitoxin system prevent-host-death family antitoxin [Dermatophilus congolensis]
MRSIGVKELKQNASRVLAEVERDGEVEVTVSGRPVATIRPLARSAPWVSPAHVAQVFAGARTSDGVAWLEELANDRARPEPVIDPFDDAGL